MALVSEFMQQQESNANESRTGGPTATQSGLSFLQGGNAAGGSATRNPYMTAIQSYSQRPWASGDVYSPHDIKPGQMRAWAAKREPQKYDMLELMGIDGKDQYLNVPLLTEFVTELGRIKGARQTGLSRKSQRRIAKAIRRAVGIGIMPSTYHHPEILKQRWQWHA